MPNRILIVEDHPLVRAALHQVLQNEGFEDIHEAGNGQEAISRAAQIRPDLIILDLAMPLVDGFKTAREIGGILPGVPILMHTLYWSPRVEMEALKVGVRKTVAKSDSNVLITAVRELLSPSGTAQKPRIEQSEEGSGGIEPKNPQKKSGTKGSPPPKDPRGLQSRPNDCDLMN